MSASEQQHVPRREGEEPITWRGVSRVEYSHEELLLLADSVAADTDGDLHNMVGIFNGNTVMRLISQADRATLPQPGGWRPSRDQLFALLCDLSVPSPHGGRYIIPTDLIGPAADAILALSLPPVPIDGGKQDGSASSNSATRLASQGCDTDAPSSAGGDH